MTITGTVVNGAVIPDAGTQFPEGARVHMALVDECEEEWPDFTDETFPPDHPMAPFNRELEIAILKESLESVKNGEVCIPLRQAFEEISKKHGLGPMLSE